MKVGDWCIVEIYKDIVGLTLILRVCQIVRITSTTEEGEEHDYIVDVDIHKSGNTRVWYTSKKKLTLITKEVADIMRGIL